MEEIWQDISGFEGLYSISTRGRVRSNSREMWNGINTWISEEKILKNYLNDRGYYEVSLLKNGVRKLCSIHRLVATAFIPNPLNKREVNHLLEKTNNFVENLCWATPKENMRHAFYTKRISHVGIKNGGCKLSEKQVIEIRKKYSKESNYTNIGKKYNVSYWTISQIINRQTWTHI